MLGFGDFWVAAAYFSCLGSTLLCLVYGLLRWNDEDHQPVTPHRPQRDWEVEEEI